MLPRYFNYRAFHRLQFRPRAKIDGQSYPKYLAVCHFSVSRVRLKMIFTSIFNTHERLFLDRKFLEISSGNNKMQNKYTD